MVTWTHDELAKIAAAEELELPSVRRDDTLGNPVTIWVVRVGDDLYVRSWKGDAGAWFRAAQVRHAGITYLAFYAGWPNAFSTLPVAKRVFDRWALPWPRKDAALTVTR